MRSWSRTCKIWTKWIMLLISLSTPTNSGVAVELSGTHGWHRPSHAVAHSGLLAEARVREQSQSDFSTFKALPFATSTL